MYIRRPLLAVEHVRVRVPFLKLVSVFLSPSHSDPFFLLLPLPSIIPTISLFTLPLCNISIFRCAPRLP